MPPALRTTVVGSYPIPAWLAASPVRQALRDAVLMVLKTQELAGIDDERPGPGPRPVSGEVTTCADAQGL